METPNLKWLRDGIGKTRLFHASCPDGKKINTSDEYLKLLNEGWVHRKESLSPSEIAPPDLPEIKPDDLDEDAIEVPEDLEPEPDLKPKKKRRKSKGNTFAR